MACAGACSVKRFLKDEHLGEPRKTPVKNQENCDPLGGVSSIVGFLVFVVYEKSEKVPHCIKFDAQIRSKLPIKTVRSSDVN